MTEEQKGHKLCSFVLVSKVICLHVSRVSARNFLSTDFTLFFLVILEIRGEMGGVSFLRNYLFMSGENRNFAGEKK